MSADIILYEEFARRAAARRRRDPIAGPVMFLAVACFYVLMAWALVNVCPHLVHHWI